MIYLYNNIKCPLSKTHYFLICLWVSLMTSAFGQFDTKATPIESISVKEGFEIELLFTVPKDRLGSWVNLCLDNKNRIIASVQRKEVVSMGPSTVSPMPPCLLNMMEKEEIMDLLAYILSSGDNEHSFFSN